MIALFVDSEFNVWGCGKNDAGQLGLQRSTFQTAPVIIPNLPPISMVSAQDHSLFLDLEGYVWGCGKNSSHQLGSEDTKSFINMRKIKKLPEIRSVAG